MTNRLANAAREALLLSTSADWLAAGWRILAVKTTYVFSAAHDFLDDVTVGHRIGNAALTTTTNSAGRANAGNVLIPSAAGQQVQGLWVYNSTGVESTSRLYAWIDRTWYGSPIAYTTTTSGIVVEWGVLRGVWELKS